MRARQGGNPVPDRFSGSRGRNRGSLKSNNVEILDGLGVNMDFAARLPQKIFNLLNDASLGAVLTVQKRRNDSDAQLKPARAQERGSRRQQGPTLVARCLAAGKVCPIRAKDMHS